MSPQRTWFPHEHCSTLLHWKDLPILPLHMSIFQLSESSEVVLRTLSARLSQIYPVATNLHFGVVQLRFGPIPCTWKAYW
uniref:Autophagy protein 5 n=1 Tax=Steinernema glaseri TaxID=37863 RepID=A0A1I7ZL59_9BILA